MGNSSDPSILEYARFYGIASDFTAVDPLTYIDDTYQIPTPELQPSPVTEQLQKAQQTITQALLKEKLDIKKESARLLSTVIRDAGAKPEDINWADVLPAFSRMERFQVEPPIFPAEHDTDTMLARKRLRYEDCEIQLQPLEEPQSVAALPSCLPGGIYEAMDKIKFEKLSCSKDAFRLIQDAKNCADELTFPESPALVLSNADDMHFRSSSPVASLQMPPYPISPRVFAEYSSQTSDKSSDSFEPEGELNRFSGHTNSYGSSSSSRISVADNQDSKINTQTTPSISTNAETLHLGIDAQSFASANCLSRADSSLQKKISESSIGTIVSSADTSTPSATKDPSTADGEVSKAAETITQLHLPGHRPNNPRTADLKCINSPLRERIFVLAPRYEHLYLLISHGTSSRKVAQGGSAGITWTVEKRTLASFASLLAFCNSMSDCTTIVPLWVPSAPEALAKWILSLHDKHAIELPQADVATPRQTGFTPVNPKPQPQLTRAEHDAMEESNWEHFLRRAGLNPYAAQAVLAILSHKTAGMEMNVADGVSVQEYVKIGALSSFIEMTAVRRRELFEKLMGEKVVGRISRVLEKDWQCDWALNFNHSAEL
ncbi:hypothetical protein P170DRAFT_510344 [Aspergillus steynii IBT 23096]|uniref:Uncharacterized protein n=1 Tax=Aspergillus steynii IBT 23096 TaxID=1392250 RepID=A0A2I2G3R2_9EURO|nr:uncharacterized protein P170DRAFT_510344 [Aspergillus steynii IBT 23096]PLB47511.1 hypothetical protein P170DRAFT_510344 [Aspergillus steynii IBT 23096]